MMNKEKKEVVLGLAWGGGIVALALLATLARQLGYMEADTVTRLVIGVNGIMIAWYGNRMPKAFAPTATARRLARVAGWSLALSGLVYAGLWAFAPIPVAVAGGCAAIVAGIAVTASYCLSLRAKEKAA
jgi:hypothetical protein